MVFIEQFSSIAVCFLGFASSLKSSYSLFAKGCNKSTTLVNMNTFDAAFAIAAGIWFVLVVLCVGDQTQIADFVVVLVTINMINLQVWW